MSRATIVVSDRAQAYINDQARLARVKIARKDLADRIRMMRRSRTLGYRPGVAAIRCPRE